MELPVSMIVWHVNSIDTPNISLIKKTKRDLISRMGEEKANQIIIGATSPQRVPQKKSIDPNSPSKKRLSIGTPLIRGSKTQRPVSAKRDSSESIPPNSRNTSIGIRNGQHGKGFALKTMNGFGIRRASQEGDNPKN